MTTECTLQCGICDTRRLVTTGKTASIPAASTFTRAPLRGALARWSPSAAHSLLLRRCAELRASSAPLRSSPARRESRRLARSAKPAKFVRQSQASLDLSHSLCSRFCSHVARLPIPAASTFARAPLSRVVLLSECRECTVEGTVSVDMRARNGLRARVWRPRWRIECTGRGRQREPSNQQD